MMKISQSQTAFSSGQKLFRFYASVREESRGKSSVARQRQPGTLADDTAGPGRMMVDRIYISRHEDKQSRSNYSADLRSQSTVASVKTGQINQFQEKQLLEKIVGGIIDREVSVRHVLSGRDFSIDDIGGNQKKSVKNAFQNYPLSGGVIQKVRAREIELSRTQLYFESEQAEFSSRGQVKTEDGRMIEFTLNMSLERSFLSRTEERTLIHRWMETVQLTDPLVISLDGRAPLLTNAVFEFDLDSDGKKDLINFTAPGSGFLALDKNEDGLVNNGSELFGPGTGNGFNELAEFDEDQNQWIDENDAVFAKLKVWSKDAQGNDRLISLQDAGIGAIFWIIPIPDLI